MTFSRRGFLSTAATGAGALWLGARWSELQAAGAHAAGAGSSTSYDVFSPQEAETFEAFAAQIIPGDDLPGAREANVVRFVDRALATFAAPQRQLFQNGLAAVAQRVSALSAAGSFAALDGTSQIAVMQALEIAQPEFFEAARVATITAMFANPEYGGNQDKVGWRLIGFDDRFIWQPPFGYYDREEPR